MDSIDNDTWIILAGAAIIAAVALGAWFYYLKQRTSKLQHRFGPEYARTVDQLGSQDKAESELAARERRVSRFHIVPLTPPEAARFAGSWKALQMRFVDDPKGAVADADRLVREVMAQRGYPMGDFERSAADLSVDHPVVVSNYRAAKLIADRDARGEADTEELRKAVVHYRALFDDLLETSPAADARTPQPRDKVKT